METSDISEVPDETSKSSSEKSGAFSPGNRLGRASASIDRGAEDVYSYVGGALYRVFLTLSIQATRAYYIFVIKLFVWSFIPLATIISLLIQIAPLSPALLIICYSTIFVIFWTVITVLIRSFKSNADDEAPEIQPVTTKQKSTGLKKIVGAIKGVLSALLEMMRDLITGKMKPVFILGLLVRVFGLLAFLFLSYAHIFLGMAIEDDIWWLKNALYWAEYGLFDFAVATPIKNTANFIAQMLN